MAETEGDSPNSVDVQAATAARRSFAAPSENFVESREIKRVAERQGFEPWVRKRTTVFETAPFDHSGTSPH